MNAILRMWEVLTADLRKVLLSCTDTGRNVETGVGFPPVVWASTREAAIFVGIVRENFIRSG